MISHAHGDHYFGLIGLISTLSLLKRDKKLKIYCPTSVLKIIQAHIKFSKLNLSYDLQLIGLNSQNSENGPNIARPSAKLTSRRRPKSRPHYDLWFFFIANVIEPQAAQFYEPSVFAKSGEFPNDFRKFNIFEKKRKHFCHLQRPCFEQKS